MTRTRKEAKVIPTEQKEQIRLVNWLKKQGIRVAASANGGKRHILEGRRLKLMGVSAGFPDLIIPLPAGKYHGLYIEMKRIEGSSVSEEQSEWLAYLRSQGYYAEVAYGFEAGKKMVLYYLSLTKPKE